MTMLATQDLLLDLKSKDEIPGELRAYFQQRLFNHIHQVLLGLLSSEEQFSKEFSKRKLAKRIEKKPEQITRWLSYPGNMTLETLSDLLLGFGCELEVQAKDIIEKRKELQQMNTLLMDIRAFHQESVRRTFNNPKDVPLATATINTTTYLKTVPRQEIQNNA